MSVTVKLQEEDMVNVDKFKQPRQGGVGESECQCVESDM